MLVYYSNVFTGDVEAMDKFNRRLVKVGKQHVQECKELLQLMGVPYIEVCLNVG